MYCIIRLCLLLLYLVRLAAAIVFAANPIDITNVCQFPDNWARTAGFQATTVRLGFSVASNTYKELLNYPGLFNFATQKATVTQPNFSLGGFPFFTGLYGLTVWPINLLVELQGYFVPPESGNYTFTLQGSDDAAILFFANPSTFSCGSQNDWPQPREADITVTDTLVPSRTLYLVKGVAYPIRIAYYNGSGEGKLNVSFKDPSGTTHTDWKGYVWQYSNTCSTCTYTKPPTQTTTYSSGWVLNPTTTGTSYSLYTGIDGIESTYTIYQVEVPTITPSLSIPPITTVTISHSDYIEEDIVSFFSTTTTNGSPVTGSSISTRTVLIIPPPKTVTITQQGWVEEDELSFFSTIDANGHPVTGTKTRTISVSVSLPPAFTTTFTSDYEQIIEEISYVPTVAADGKPTYATTTKTLSISHFPAPPPTTQIIDLGNQVTEYDVISYYTTLDANGKLITTSHVDKYSPPPVTTITIYENHEHVVDVYSYFITVNGEGQIITDSVIISASTSYDPAPSPETKIIDLGNEVTEYDVISYYTTQDANGKIITTSTTTKYSPPPLTVTATTGEDYVESDWISFFITVDEKGEIVTSSTLFNATRDYKLPEAPHTSFGPAPPVETHTVVLENNMTNYEVVSFWTTTNEFGGVITTSSTRTYSAPPLTVTATTGEDYVESDWISFFITVDEKGEIVTSSTLFNATRDYKLPEAPHTSFGPAPPVETHTVVLENNMTNYEVVSFWTTTNEFGGVITTSSTRTYSAPPLTVTATTGEDYVESDWISFFITVDEKERLLPAALCSMLRVVSFWTTTNEFGGVITTSSTRTYSAPPLTVTATTGEDYVESDWISFFITVDEKGEIVTSSTLFNATRDYIDAEAQHTSFGPAPPVETHTVVLENNMTNYEVVSFWTTTNEFGGVITTSSTRTYSAPPLTVTATTGEDYVESDWISFFITVDEKERLLPAALCSMLRVVSFWTTTNEFGGVITTSSTRTYSAPPLTVTATTGEDYVESDWISFFITVDEGEIVTSSTLFNATRDYKLPEAPHTSFGPAPPVETHTVVLENNMTNYEVVSFWTTTNEFGGVITTSSTRTYSAPPLTVTATTGEDYVESDWISFFITVDEKERLLPAALCSMLRVVSFWTTTNEFGGVITTSSTRTYSAPPLTVTATTGEDYVESDWISFFITVDEKGDCYQQHSVQCYA
ncbi:Hypothetical protein J6891_03058 [Nakaseomyces glabratus]